MLENDFIDFGWLLKDLEETSSNDDGKAVRYQLTSSSLGTIIKSMDTEYDRNALKAVPFATRSRKEITELGINADRAVTFFAQDNFSIRRMRKSS